MRKMNIFKALLVVLVLSLCVFISGCRTPKYDVAYINGKLDATGFTSYVYEKTIKAGDILLLEEKTNATQQGDKFLVKTEVSKLSAVEETEKYTKEETEETVAIAADPITLTITETDFSEVEVTKDSLTGTVKDDVNVLGYAVKGLNIKIDLANEKVANVEITYVDAETNFVVTVKVQYNY